MKALLPTVESLMVGTSRRLEVAERSDRRPGRSATRARDPKNGGVSPCDVVGSSAYMCLGLALFLGLSTCDHTPLVCLQVLDN